jgi:long-chain acyl-CoA synthetase
VTTDTGNDTMAALARSAAERYGSTVAAVYRRDDEWVELGFDDMWQQVRELALGLIGLGVEPGDRVSILSDTRVEFALVDLAVSSVGAIVVPVYPSSSPDECEWVVGNSGATVIVCENAAQAAKIAEVRSRLPELRHVVVIDGEAPDAIPLAQVPGLDADVDPAELDRRIAAVSLDDPCLIIYTSGTTGRPKGVVLTNRGFAAARRSAIEMALFGQGDTAYLYLPLAHVFAQLIMADCIEVGAAIVFWGGDTAHIVAELGQLKPTVLPSVPRIFEKVYSLALGMVPPGGEADLTRAVQLGVQIRDAQRRGEEVESEALELFERVDREMFSLVRGIFGGRLRYAVSGAAPIAKEILEFFYAAGVPVFEGWGMTETTSIGTLNLPDAYRFGTIGRPVAGAVVRIAEDGEIELAGDMVMRGYWNNPDATAETMTEDGFLRTGDLGAIDEDGYVSITGRKKDIIITAGGKNLTPANIEGDLRRSRWISQVVMYGDRRPYPVALITLDPEEILAWAATEGLPADLAELAEHEQVRALVQAEIDRANASYAKVGQIKRFTILPRDFSLDAGELTPSLKLKRNVVYERYADELDRLYT